MPAAPFPSRLRVPFRRSLGTDRLVCQRSLGRQGRDADLFTLQAAAYLAPEAR
jgi:hypothetical protein